MAHSARIPHHFRMIPQRYLCVDKPEYSLESPRKQRSLSISYATAEWRALLNKESGLSGGPVEWPAAQQVQVDMENRLARARAGVDDGTVDGTFKTALVRKLSGHKRQMPEQLGIFVLSIVQ